MLDVEVLVGDITKSGCDFIVNAANKQLKPGGGVCGAIYAAAGPELEAETSLVAPLVEFEEFYVSKGYLLCKNIIHVAAPHLTAGENSHYDLYCTYIGALTAALCLKADTVALPLLGAGIYGWPVEDSAAMLKAALSYFNDYVKEQSDLTVKLYCFNDEIAEGLRMVI